MSTFTLTHPTLGHITVTERPGSGKISARWTAGQLKVNIPAGLSRRRIADTIDRHAADFERIRPRPRYLPDTVIPIPATDLTIAILTSSQITRLTLTAPAPDRFNILLPPSADTSSPAIQSAIDTAVKAIARRIAPAILLPRARQLAADLGLRVDRWEIAHGMKVLGTCYPRQRRIRLSYLNVFLTPELRDYIIHHELAHLTEPGHTPAFHSLCDRYCSGRERLLISLLHKFPWPVER